MNNRYDVYLASPLNTEEARAAMDSAKAIIHAAGFSVFDPRASGGVIAKMSPDERLKHAENIFLGNIAGMDASETICACIDERDTGVSFELGYMYRAAIAGHKVALITFSAHGHGANVMLAQSVDYHCPTLGQLKQFMNNYSSKLRECIQENKRFPKLKVAPSNG